MFGSHTSESNLSESFPLVIMWGYFLFHHGPHGLPNITLQIPRKECLQIASWGPSCNSVRWIHRSERSFSESSFHVLNWWYFLYQRRPQCDPKKVFSGSSKTVLMDCSMKDKCNSVRWIHTSIEVSTKASFYFSPEDTCFVSVSFSALRISHCRF